MMYLVPVGTMYSTPGTPGTPSSTVCTKSIYYYVWCMYSYVIHDNTYIHVNVQ